MDRVEAGEHALLFLRLDLRLGGAAVAALVHEDRDLGIGLQHPQRERVLSRDRQECHAHQRVGSGGEHGQRFGARVAIFVFHRERDVQPFAAADPVALHRLDRIRPARQAVQPVQQFLRIRGDLQEPLRNLALLDQRAGAPAAAVDHLLVREHGLVDRVPVHHRLLAVRHALLEQAHEHALLVHVIVGLAGREFARPVDRVTQRRQLRAHVLDVRVGPLRGRGLVLDRRVLGRQPERIPAQRLQHVLALHALEARDHIADRVIAQVADMQRPRRIRQHRQAVILRTRIVLAHIERMRARPVRLRSSLDRARIVGVGGRSGGAGAGFGRGGSRIGAVVHGRCGVDARKAVQPNAAGDGGEGLELLCRQKTGSLSDYEVGQLHIVMMTLCAPQLETKMKDPMVTCT